MRVIEYYQQVTSYFRQKTNTSTPDYSIRLPLILSLNGEDLPVERGRYEPENEHL
ncbi:hypothetical protein QBC16_005016 [Citrobacter freundii]|nr:hypothetical protein [Citrobacter freundii]EKW7471587.1 hypothetical protein [Citrobacter freundii]